MAIKKGHIVALFLSLFFTLNSIGQDVESLEKQVRTLQRDIQLAERLLKETSKNKEATLSQMNILQAQINKKEKLVEAYQGQIALLERDISSNKKEISSLQKKLEATRKEYANLIAITYRNVNTFSEISFIFSADSFNQAIKRLRYVQQFREQLQNKIKEIDGLEKGINNQLSENEKEKKAKDLILAQEKKAKSSLVADKKELDKQIASLKKKEKKIQGEIKGKENEAKQLKKQIEKAIAEEMKRHKDLNNEDLRLSNTFAENKGKLPWPVKEGLISNHYGASKHPTQPKVTINNNGVDIATTKDAKARAVYYGEVSIVINNGSNNAVLIRHGNYFTLYSNLDAVYVKKGDKVKVMSEIGHIHTNSLDEKTILHFEVWEDKKTVNPESWIVR